MKCARPASRTWGGATAADATHPLKSDIRCTIIRVPENRTWSPSTADGVPDDPWDLGKYEMEHGRRYPALHPRGSFAQIRLKIALKEGE